MSVPIREEKGAFMSYKECASQLNELQTNQNYRNNESAAGAKADNSAPPSVEKRLGNPFGGKAKAEGGKGMKK